MVYTVCIYIYKKLIRLILVDTNIFIFSVIPTGS